MSSMRSYYNNSESLYMPESYTKAQSLSGYGSIQIIKAQALLAMRKEGEETLTPSGRIMSKDERKGVRVV